MPNGKTDCDAYIFSVEQSTTTASGLKVYKLSYGGDKPAYLARNSKCPTGAKSLQVGAGKPVQFILDCPSKSEGAISVSDWETEPCYVKIAGSNNESSGYMGYNQKSNIAEFVTDLAKHNDGTMWLLFKLERLPTQDVGGHRAPIPHKIRPPVHPSPNIDDDDSELEFGS